MKKFLLWAGLSCLLIVGILAWNASHQAQGSPNVSGTHYPITTKTITIGENTAYGTATLSVQHGTDHLVVRLNDASRPVYDSDVNLDVGSIAIGSYKFGSNALQPLTINVNSKGFSGKGYVIG